MNPLETLKVKPSVLQREPVIVKILNNEKTKPMVVDKRSQGYDPQAFLERMQKNQLSKVIANKKNEKALELVMESKAPIELIETKKKKTIKKLKAPQFIIMEENEPPIAKQRKTEKIVKGITELGTENMIEFGDTILKRRLPSKDKNEKIDIRVSSYFMNNREIFVNFINGLFEPYKDDLLDEVKGITCKNIGQTNQNKIELLTHQKLVRDYMNSYTPYRGLLLYHGLGAGKCHAKDTPIMMSDGTIKLVQNINVGDFLMGDDSSPRKVISLANGKDKMYDIIPIKGEKYRVNQEHILCLRASGFPKLCRNNHAKNTNYNVQWIENNTFQSKTFTFNKGKNNKNEMQIEAEKFYQILLDNTETNDNIIEIAVKDYLQLSNKKKAFLKGYKVPIDFVEKELPMDPYMIGYWLGDGSSYGAKITSQDLNTLKELNMINNKHIPLLYKCNSRENRLKLLAGLLDSDGSFDQSKNTFEFTQKNEQLMDDVIYLARSLGFACYKKHKETSWTYKGIKNYGSAFRIHISGMGLEEIPTKIPRKQCVNARKQIKDCLVTGIKVKYVNEDEYYGFMIDGNSRYVMGDFTVTHNTAASIGIAEGLKSSHKIIVMTPASLKRNYLEEIKKYGDSIYRKNQYWEWISITENPETVDTLSSVLSLPVDFIKRKHGAWLINVTKPNNYNELSSTDKKSLDEQLDEMIQNKYTFINYNGLRREKFKQLTNNFEKNIFDNAVVIIDEAHNLIGRIVNKINKLKTFTKGPTSNMPTSLWLQIYEFLLRANNSRVVLLTGTPIINYPNEIGILFNILRGYIKTWHFTLNIDNNNKLSKETLLNIFTKEKVLDYMDYNASSKTLSITRNPYGFESKITEKSGYKGVKTEYKEENGKLIVDEKGTMSDEDFIKRITKLLKKNEITAIPKGTQFVANTALPDTLDEFINLFVDKETGNVHNIEKFKRRIIGLTSYFKSAQEELLPRYDKITDYHVIKLPMSNYQFKIYEEARVEERKREKKSKQGVNKVDANGMFIQPKSTYRIFSRLFCNFVMPRPPGRPIPGAFSKKGKSDKEEDEEKEEEEDEDDLEL